VTGNRLNVKCSASKSCWVCDSTLESNLTVTSLFGVGKKEDLKEDFLSKIEEFLIDCNNANHRVTAMSLPRFEEKLLTGCLSYKVMNCQITRLEPNVFKTLKTLKSLQLVNDSLEGIPENAFFGLNQLEVLNLTNNRITTLKQNMFTPLVNLTKLDVSFNRLIFLPKKLFKENAQLGEISFRGNQLHVIGTEFKGIKTFNFDDNPCTSSGDHDVKSLEGIKDRCSYEKFLRTWIEKTEKLNREMKAIQVKLGKLENKSQEVLGKLKQISNTSETNVQETNTNILLLGKKFDDLVSNLDKNFTNVENVLDYLQTSFKKSQEDIKTEFINLQNETNFHLESRLSVSQTDYENLARGHRSLEQSFKEYADSNEFQKKIFWALLGFLVLIVFDLMLAFLMVVREMTK
jgi:Leucine-rich repeat (LRR) protein